MITLDDIRAAQTTIAGAVQRTPTGASQTLSEITDASVNLKFEVFQFTASYKERGARNRLSALTAEERERGVVAVSAGNHAQGVAYHAGLLGIPATIIMPKGTPFVKVARTRHLGAEVEITGNDLEEAMTRGRELIEKGLTFVHPFDDPLIVAGQGTVALEMLEDKPSIDTLVVPIGGGGLIAGMAIAAHALRKGVRIIGVQSERYPSMARAFHNDTSPIPAGGTIAEGIAVGVASGITVPIIRELVTDVVTVSEEAIEDAVNLIVEIEKVVVEGAGAAGLAAMLQHRELFAGCNAGIVLTGGNIDPSLLAKILQRGLARSGRISRLRVIIDDRPGSLARLLGVVGAQGANILEVQHQRLFTEAPARSVDVDISVETADADHRDVLLAAIGDAGYPVALLPMDSV